MQFPSSLAESPESPVADAPSRGRPREFDTDVVLDNAIRVFCERGYHATSIGELTAATGLASGSLYKAFKDKRGIFLAALARYRDTRDAALRARIERAPDGRERVRAAITHYAESSHGQCGRLGCLVVGGTTELAALDETLARDVAALLRRNESLLADLIRGGFADGTITPHIDAAATARALLCFVQGMRIVGKTGCSRKDMLALVDVAMKTLD